MKIRTVENRMSFNQIGSASIVETQTVGHFIYSAQNAWYLNDATVFKPNVSFLCCMNFSDMGHFALP